MFVFVEKGKQQKTEKKNKLINENEEKKQAIETEFTNVHCATLVLLPFPPFFPPLSC